MPSEERRLVTALFADVVGSTAIADRFDPEEARLIGNEVISRAIRMHGSWGCASVRYATFVTWSRFLS